MKFSTCFATNSIYMIFKWKVTVYIYSSQFHTIVAFNDETIDIYWNRLIRRKKRMTFGSICAQVVEIEPFKHFFCSYFTAIHEFIKCRSSFVWSGIISKVCNVRTIVLKKQITKIYVKKQRLYRFLWYTKNNI